MTLNTLHTDRPAIRPFTEDDADLDLAFLPAARGRGCAREAAAAVIGFGFAVLAVKRIVAITDPENTASARVLEAVGLRLERRLPPISDAKALCLFAIEA